MLIIHILIILVSFFAIPGNFSFAQHHVIQLGLSANDYEPNTTPQTWNLRRRSLTAWKGEAKWSYENNTPAVKLQSISALTFLEKDVNIDLEKFPFVNWKWKVVNNLAIRNELAVQGDDHPIRIFLVFDPDVKYQSLWFRIKRFLYLDRFHGHPYGGKYTEYLWSNQLVRGTTFSDPGNPKMKLIVADSGEHKLGKWLQYKRNLYKDFLSLYHVPPRRLIFVGILNDTDQTGLSATSYIKDLYFSKE